MRKTLVVSLVCLLVGLGCGDKDPAADQNDKDAGGRAGSGHQGGKGGKGGDGEPDDGGEKPPPGDAAAGHGGSNDDAGGEAGDGGDSGVDAGETDAGEDGGPVDDCEDGPYMPMGVGFSWTYRVTDPIDGETSKTTTVEGMEKVGGDGPNADETAFHVVTVKVSGGLSDMTESWQAVLDDNSVVRYREVGFKTGTSEINSEEYWEPYKLRFDQSADHIEKGAEWNEQYTETKIDKGAPVPAARNDGWIVDDVDVPCGPVHGKMLSCIKVRKTVDGAASGKTYFYARCVGKVREEGSQVEALTDYDVE